MEPLPASPGSKTKGGGAKGSKSKKVPKQHAKPKGPCKKPAASRASMQKAASSTTSPKKRPSGRPSKRPAAEMRNQNPDPDSQNFFTTEDGIFMSFDYIVPLAKQQANLLPMSEKLELMEDEIYQEWFEMKEHNASFFEPSTALPIFMESHLRERGFPEPMIQAAVRHARDERRRTRRSNMLNRMNAQFFESE